MTEEELEAKIKNLIKTQTMQDYLLGCLKSESKLNFLHTLSLLIDKASQRFEKNRRLPAN